MRVLRALLCLFGVLAGFAPAEAVFDLTEVRQLIVRYRNQWIADPDKIRDARIGVIDRLLVTGDYSGLEPLLLIINKIDVTPPQVVFQPPPKTTYEFRVTAAPPDPRCGEGPLVPFPELRNAGGRPSR